MTNRFAPPSSPSPRRGGKLQVGLLVRLALVVLVGALLLAKIQRQREAEARIEKARVVFLSKQRAATSSGKATDAGP